MSGSRQRSAWPWGSRGSHVSPLLHFVHMAVPSQTQHLLCTDTGGGRGQSHGSAVLGEGQLPLLEAGGREVCWMGCPSREEGPAEGLATSEMVLEGECFPGPMQEEGSRGTVRGRKPVVGRVPAAGGCVLPSFIRKPLVSRASCSQRQVLGSGLGQAQGQGCSGSFRNHP